MLFAIDPGHGAKKNGIIDPGAGGVLQEAKEVLDIATHLIAILESAGHKAINTRPTGDYTSTSAELQARCDAANVAKADYFISIHLNAYNGQAKGTQSFIGSDAGKGLAEGITSKLAGLGFVKREVQRANYYVLKNTTMTAILVECCFCDNAEDGKRYRDLGGAPRIAKAIAEALIGTNRGSVNPTKLSMPDAVVPGNSNRTIGDLINNQCEGTCSTVKCKGLSNQIIKQMQALAPGSLVSISDIAQVVKTGDQVNLYMQSEAKKGLERLCAAHVDKRMIVNSCYRTIAQQYLLWSFAQKGVCGISMAAPPGKSNHEDGCAVDLENHASWLSSFEASDNWQWQGRRDPMHFSWVGKKRDDIGNIGIKAFQSLWNLHNQDKLIEDGSWGAKTRAALDKSPVHGW
jgi:hypothetical protein